MNIKEFIGNIKTTIESTEFNERLKITLLNFPNQKHESHIRNTLVELYNKQKNTNQRAFAEHPRYKNKATKKRATIDFSICTNEITDFTMELKYNFPKDILKFCAKGNLNKDFINRIYNENGQKVDAFLQIVCETNKSYFSSLEKKWNLNSLSQFQLKDDKINWKNTLIDELKNAEKTVENSKHELLGKQTIKTDALPAEYYFYIIYRK
ncbi:hypothetical protein [Cellulophaga baltica]|uniref:Uncharacterized protein n=1 Tax=Cellulophaga baltica TaxID=76594 RepID=A0A1G7ENX9_9FLAO|nr:hypothetical protein [Cellulophaga baltica]SDE65349.1 hypothetical protein SAMN04487992_102427 [Cellulophaga baltica]